MSDEKQKQIEERARQIWQREGRPEGRAEAHWKQAEQELAAEAGQAGSAEQPAPYVPADEGTIEPDVDSPVVAGASVPSAPPIPAEEARKREAGAKKSEESAPYVPSDEPMLEPAGDAPVVAGASVPSEPPIPATEGQRQTVKPADTGKSSPAKTNSSIRSESKPAAAKPADDKKAEAKKGSTKKRV